MSNIDFRRVLDLELFHMLLLTQFSGVCNVFVKLSTTVPITHNQISELIFHLKVMFNHTGMCKAYMEQKAIGR
jgi:hypothetical protein